MCTAEGSVEHLEPRLLARFSDVFSLRPRPRFAAVDMPIGLSAQRVVGGRECERLARAKLGPRRSSIFSAPSRSVLSARDWAEVRGKGMSKQSFHLLPKMREVDEQMTVSRQRWIRETHPELAFARLAGAPLSASKRTAEGRAQRLRLLSGLLPASTSLYRQASSTWRRKEVAADDILDALVLAFAACDMLRGHSHCLPARAPRDPRGLRMQIWS